MFLLEVLVVGLITGVLLAAMPDMGNAFVKGFVLGALAHVLFELLGANAWYCKHGAACSA
jgi:hypothetical protein